MCVLGLFVCLFVFFSVFSSSSFLCVYNLYDFHNKIKLYSGEYNYNFTTLYTSVVDRPVTAIGAVRGNKEEEMNTEDGSGWVYWVAERVNLIHS